jgi:hypothetical protein
MRMSKSALEEMMTMTDADGMKEDELTNDKLRRNDIALDTTVNFGEVYAGHVSQIQRWVVQKEFVLLLTEFIGGVQNGSLLVGGICKCSRLS